MKNRLTPDQTAQFAVILRMLREDITAKTQRELAADLGQHVMTISEYERGVRSPKADRLIAYASALGAEPAPFIRIWYAMAGLRVSVGLDATTGLVVLDDIEPCDAAEAAHEVETALNDLLRPFVNRCRVTRQPFTDDHPEWDWHRYVGREVSDEEIAREDGRTWAQIRSGAYQIEVTGSLLRRIAGPDVTTFHRTFLVVPASLNTAVAAQAYVDDWRAESEAREQLMQDSAHAQPTPSKAAKPSATHDALMDRATHLTSEEVAQVLGYIDGLIDSRR